jgi:penicillin-binding protein 2
MPQLTFSLKYRQATVLLIVLGLLLVISGWLVKLQILNYRELAEQSENNRIRVQPLVAGRGVVYDREGRIIIDNRPSFTVSVVASEAVRDTTIPNLAALIGLDTSVVQKRLRKNLVNRYQPAPIMRDVPFEIVAVIEEQAGRFPGVSIQMEEVRRYTPNLGSECFTGHVGEVSEEERRREGVVGYRLGSIIGKKGLEKQHDALLRGREGTAYIEVTASGQSRGPYEGKAPTPAVAGADLVLTIDNDLQRECVAALGEYCCGAIVAMDPRSGEILAMTSHPGFDANIFSTVIPESLWQSIMQDTTHPLLNRPISGLYPPASTTKLLTIGAALEEGMISANTTLKPCYGGYQFGNRYFRCWEPAGHGSLNAIGAIEQSCDVYLYQVGLKLGIDLLSQYFDKCGFGHVTGVALPGEEDGLNPNSEYYDKRYGKKKWSRGLVLNNAIGQGEILVTPLQLAQFFCGLVNDGIVYRPRLIRSLRFPGGHQVIPSRQIVRKLPFSSETLELLLEALRLVVEGEHGTARGLKNNLYSLGGKTGTAENPHGDNHSLFVGVAPMGRPEIVVCAVVENAGHGSEVAAPTVKRIIDIYMTKKMNPESVADLSHAEGD